MAEQHQLGGVPDLDLREAEEIERLLKEEEVKAQRADIEVHPLKKFLNLKVVLGLAMAMVMVWGVGWGILSLMHRPDAVPRVDADAQNSQAVEDLIPAFVQVQKPNIYPLKPFFVPLRIKNQETGRFLHVTAHLVLSNRRLHKDIDKVRPLIRQSVYSLLSRKKAKHFVKGRVTIEERVKREILTASNSLLLSGTGTITDIIFTEFIISPS